MSEPTGTDSPIRCAESPPTPPISPARLSRYQVRWLPSATPTVARSSQMPRRRRTTLSACSTSPLSSPKRVSVLADATGASKDAVLSDGLVELHYPAANGELAVEFGINPARFHEIFAADLPAEEAAVMAAIQRPIAELASPTRRDRRHRCQPLNGVVSSRDHYRSRHLALLAGRLHRRRGRANPAPPIRRGRIRRMRNGHPTAAGRVRTRHRTPRLGIGRSRRLRGSGRLGEPKVSRDLPRLRASTRVRIPRRSSPRPDPHEVRVRARRPGQLAGCAVRYRGVYSPLSIPGSLPASNNHKISHQRACRPPGRTYETRVRETMIDSPNDRLQAETEAKTVSRRLW
jgi:hypothetical protein